MFYCKHEHLCYSAIVYVVQKLSSNLLNIPILSLRTSEQVGIAVRPLINPTNLKIEAWYASGSNKKELLLLPASEIREVSRYGIIVNDTDAITETDELVRFKELLSVDFQLLQKPVVTEANEKLGKVEEYAADIDSMYIQKLYLAPSLLKSFTKERLVIGRQQIVEITDKKIVVRGNELKSNSLFKVTGLAREAEA